MVNSWIKPSDTWLVQLIATIKRATRNVAVPVLLKKRRLFRPAIRHSNIRQIANAHAIATNSLETKISKNSCGVSGRYWKLWNRITARANIPLRTNLVYFPIVLVITSCIYRGKMFCQSQAKRHY